MKPVSTTMLVLLLLISTSMAHMALLYPTPRGGYGTSEYNGRIHTWIGYEDKTWRATFPCGGFKPGPETKLEAGKVVEVRFAASTMKKDQMDKQPDPKDPNHRFKQARHGGGTVRGVMIQHRHCEFSLSYDGGKSFHLIGRYTRSCPDAYYLWPVKIPSNVPSCTEKTKCLFVWSWTASILPQYYHNCADVSIQGVKNGVLPSTGIEIVNFDGHPKGVTAPGDGAGEHTGEGPNSKEKDANRYSAWN
ncbi:hypothetical protein BGZ76_008770 [Entomortierella beljakovae]|nr:hypothetical protein BGZ76_008770 [Entomortierella beljakovae]